VKVTLELDTDPFVAGKQVTGRVNVDESGSSRSLTMTLSFHERTRDFHEIRYSSDLVVHQGNTLAGDAYDFEFTMPPEAPPSIKTKYGELYWELRLKSDQPGLDTNEDRRVEVVAAD
jgi:hypothetical protein